MELKQVGKGKDDVCPLINFPWRKKRGAADSQCIAVKTITVNVSRQAQDDKKLEWKDFACEVVQDTKNSPCPLYREYDPANFLVVHFSPSTRFDAVSKFLTHGVILRYKDFTEERFLFFGHSASQLRERTCVLYN